MALKRALNRISFNAADTAVVRAEDIDGRLVLPIFITRLYVEDTWEMAYRENTVRQKIADSAAELAALASEAHAAGKRELVLDDLSQTA